MLGWNGGSGLAAARATLTIKYEARKDTPV